MACPAPAEPQAAPQHHGQQQHRYRQQPADHCLHACLRGGDVVFPLAADWLCCHKQAVIRRPALHGVIGQIPAGEHCNIAGGVAVVQRLGQVLLPDNVAVLVQHHGPGIAVHPLGRGVGGVPLQAVGGGVQGLGQGTHFLHTVGCAIVPHAGVDRHAQQQRHHHQNDTRRGQYIAADEPRKSFHRRASPASL